MDATSELRKPATMTAPVLADDLRGDRDGRFLRCTRSEVEAYRTGQPSDLGLGEPCLAQPLQTLLMGLP